MALNETEERYDEAVFEWIVCPVCGRSEWGEIRFEGVFCDTCNTEVSLKPTNGDDGFLAEFDDSYIRGLFVNRMFGPDKITEKHYATDEGYPPADGTSVFEERTGELPEREASE